MSAPVIHDIATGLEWAIPSAIVAILLTAAARDVGSEVRRRRKRKRHTLAELCDLSRDDVDPNWPLVKGELGLPGFMDAHIVKDPVLPLSEDPEGGTS